MIRRSRTSCERPAGFSRRACHVTCCARYSSIACEKIVLLLRAQRVSAATVLAGGSKSEAKAGEEVSPSPLLLDSVPAFSGTARRVWRGGVSESRSCGLFSVWRRRCFRSDERLIYLWNFNSRETRVPDAAEGPVSSLAYSPNGICSAHEGIEQGRAGVRVWDLRSGERLDLAQCGEQSPSIAFSAGGKSVCERRTNRRAARGICRPAR